MKELFLLSLILSVSFFNHSFAKREFIRGETHDVKATCSIYPGLVDGKIHPSVHGTLDHSGACIPTDNKVLSYLRHGEKGYGHKSIKNNSSQDIFIELVPSTPAKGHQQLRSFIPQGGHAFIQYAGEGQYPGIDTVTFYNASGNQLLSVSAKDKPLNAQSIFTFTEQNQLQLSNPKPEAAHGLQTLFNKK